MNGDISFRWLARRVIAIYMEAQQAWSEYHHGCCAVHQRIAPSYRVPRPHRAGGSRVANSDLALTPTLTLWLAVLRRWGHTPWTSGSWG